MFVGDCGAELSGWEPLGVKCWVGLFTWGLGVVSGTLGFWALVVMLGFTVLFVLGAVLVCWVFDFRVGFGLRFRWVWILRLWVGFDLL